MKRTPRVDQVHVAGQDHQIRAAGRMPHELRQLEALRQYKKNPEFETTVFFEYRDIENKYHSFTGGLIRGGWPKKQLTDAVQPKQTYCVGNPAVTKGVLHPSNMITPRIVTYAGYRTALPMGQQKGSAQQLSVHTRNCTRPAREITEYTSYTQLCAVCTPSSSLLSPPPPPRSNAQPHADSFCCDIHLLKELGTLPLH
uniref:Uncharacterized protein n=1 Tax=Pristionchus pacificus TaxID=54126 RepID=A0A2A6BTB4_PRIPA|eukprot:PDM69046.1 hypothetical protein PRIPAC_47348 [Pristionchus pacificus]